MAVAARLAFRDSWGRLCIRRRKRKHRERQQNQCRRADESTHNRKYDRFRILHCNSPVCPNILRKPIPGRTDHNGMAAPGNVRITGVYASRAAGGVTGISESASGSIDVLCGISRAWLCLDALGFRLWQGLARTIRGTMRCRKARATIPRDYPLFAALCHGLSCCFSRIIVLLHVHSTFNLNAADPHNADVR